MTITFLTLSTLLAPALAIAQSMPTPTPTPASEGLPGSAVALTAPLVSWFSGQASEYGNNTLCATAAALIAGCLLIFIIFFMRRPKKPLDTHAPT